MTPRRTRPGRPGRCEGLVVLLLVAVACEHVPAPTGWCATPTRRALTPLVLALLDEEDRRVPGPTSPRHPRCSTTSCSACSPSCAAATGRAPAPSSPPAAWSTAPPGTWARAGLAPLAAPRCAGRTAGSLAHTAAMAAARRPLSRGALRRRPRARQVRRRRRRRRLLPAAPPVRRRRHRRHGPARPRHGRRSRPARPRWSRGPPRPRPVAAEPPRPARRPPRLRGPRYRSSATRRPDPGPPVAAAGALGRIGSPPAAAALVRASPLAADPRCSATAAEALGRIGDPDSAAAAAAGMAAPEPACGPPAPTRSPRLVPEGRAAGGRCSAGPGAAASVARAALDVRDPLRSRAGGPLMREHRATSC